MPLQQIPLPRGVAAPLVTEAPKLIQSSTLLALEPKPNEISLGKPKVSGIAVEVVKRVSRSNSLIRCLLPPTVLRKTTSFVILSMAKSPGVETVRHSFLERLGHCPSRSYRKN